MAVHHYPGRGERASNAVHCGALLLDRRPLRHWDAERTHISQRYWIQQVRKRGVYLRSYDKMNENTRLAGAPGFPRLAGELLVFLTHLVLDF